MYVREIVSVKGDRALKMYIRNGRYSGLKGRKDGGEEPPFVEVSFSAVDIKPNAARTRVYCGMQLLYTDGSDPTPPPSSLAPAENVTGWAERSFFLRE